MALLAEVLVRLDDLNTYLSARGYLDGKGKVRPAAELAGRMRREAADYLDAMGMTPRARTRLGLDLSRSFDLAQHWALEDDEQRHDGDDEERPRSDAEPHSLPPSQLGDTPEKGSCHGEGDDGA